MYEAIFMENQVKGKHIILCGMMGSGKTVIGRELTALNGMDFIDTDLEIEKMAHMSINEIFSVHGEEHFRRQEESVIKNILKRPPSVIALGGGALREINFIETVKRSGYVIWLWSDIINLIKRTNDGKRPLLKNDDPGKTLSELLKKRFGDYSRTSDIIIDTDNRTTEETARKIYNETNKII